LSCCRTELTDGCIQNWLTAVSSLLKKFSHSQLVRVFPRYSELAVLNFPRSTI
jgi:hypothetical protein